MSKSIHITYKNLKGLTKKELEEQFMDPNSDLAELAKKSSLKKMVLKERKRLKKIVTLVIMLNSISCFTQNNRVLENELYKPTESEKARIFYNEAHDFFEQKKFQKAVELYKLAIKEDENYIDAYDNLGLTYRQMNLLDSAEHYYLLSHKKYPMGTVAISNLAVVQEYKGNTEGAISYYTKCTEIEPENPEGYYGLSRMYLNNKKYNQALKNGKLAEKYYTKMNSPYIGDCYYVLCLICYYNNDKLTAKKYLNLAKNSGIKVDNRIENDLK